MTVKKTENTSTQQRVYAEVKVIGEGVLKVDSSTLFGSKVIQAQLETLRRISEKKNSN